MAEEHFDKSELCVFGYLRTPYELEYKSIKVTEAKAFIDLLWNALGEQLVWISPMIPNTQSNKLNYNLYTVIANYTTEWWWNEALRVFSKKQKQGKFPHVKVIKGFSYKWKRDCIYTINNNSSQKEPLFARYENEDRPTLGSVYYKCSELKYQPAKEPVMKCYHEQQHIDHKNVINLANSHTICIQKNNHHANSNVFETPAKDAVSNAIKWIQCSENKKKTVIIEYLKSVVSEIFENQTLQTVSINQIVTDIMDNGTVPIILTSLKDEHVLKTNIIEAYELNKC